MPLVIFVTGATGYLGRPLVERLAARGHRVSALARPASAHKLPAHCVPVIGDALDPASYSVPPRSVVVHLVGVAHPSPTRAKAAQFRSIDLASVAAAVSNARAADARRFVYVSVAQPAPVMKAYLEARAAGEALVRESGLPATLLRPWYVLGPGHRWPVILAPLYGLARLFPASRPAAERLGLVTREQMLGALVRAAESEARGVKVVEVPEIARSEPSG
jgi:uncharacterized protein YbjT (DUF2867 family)